MKDPVPEANDLLEDHADDDQQGEPAVPAPAAQ
jgi:hypothetical protein